MDFAKEDIKFAISADVNDWMELVSRNQIRHCVYTGGLVLKR